MDADDDKTLQIVGDSVRKTVFLFPQLFRFAMRKVVFRIDKRLCYDGSVYKISFYSLNSIYKKEKIVVQNGPSNLEKLLN